MSRHSITSPTRSTKIRALLSGGLVLGLGAGLTMATWTDRAFVEGAFATSGFNILALTDPAEGWVEADVDTEAATLGFDLPLAGELQPGSVVYAPVSLRTDDGSEAAEVRLGAATLAEGDPALFDALTYTLARTSQCDADGVAAASVAREAIAEGLHLDVAPTPSFTLAADAGDEVDLCYAVRLPNHINDLSLAGTSASARWEFTAEAVTS
ncbi:SipW-dependent-type signal peptide-containing protein [Georgenia sp. 10Sc9-8]|uniref:SipW-dependent-type signal peptide-containing protein n=1 Tax=Georgenia halotolerans TaxID=3028317 RepID=A0ABT5U0Y3_9MICO|nr:SipW-dependent-type signal peptide-containing protein [Georgenia halotolerans]